MERAGDVFWVFIFYYKTAEGLNSLKSDTFLFITTW